MVSKEANDENSKRQYKGKGLKRTFQTYREQCKERFRELELMEKQYIL